MEANLLASTCLLLVISSVSTADWTLSVHLVSYYKPHSIVPNSMGTEYCCCTCVNQLYCQEQANRVNLACVNNEIYHCRFSLSFCAIQGNSSVCRNTSFFNIDNSTTFGGTVGDLTNPIHLIMPGNLGTENIVLTVSITHNNNGTNLTVGNFSNLIPPQPNESFSVNTIQTTSNDQYLSASIMYAYRLLNCSVYDCLTPETATSSIPTTSASIIIDTSIPTISASNTNEGTTTIPITSVIVSRGMTTSVRNTNGDTTIPITSVSVGGGTSVLNTNGGSSTITSARVSSINGGSVSTSVQPITSSTGVPTPSSSGGCQVQSSKWILLLITLMMSAALVYQ